MPDIQYFKEKDKTWFRNFAEQHNITFKELTTEIFPHTKSRTIEKLWQRKNAAQGAYADVLYWYAQAKHKNWKAVTPD
ncbi:hypothetical protein PN36_04060 [Candidatus Thiomargarita nelsonii]|uniref:Uncharacterized protein n=1 Tax=Candidatus Thiomargarita nelsonii TaxID=1003181 RepID=A0A0A6PM51_9GAMM|nr:hypothetical protein PN36_04060 [Candidatus Thiomargarita nelsonii]